MKILARLKRLVVGKPCACAADAALEPETQQLVERLAGEATKSQMVRRDEQKRLEAAYGKVLAQKPTLLTAFDLEKPLADLGRVMTGGR